VAGTGASPRLVFKTVSAARDNDAIQSFNDAALQAAALRQRHWEVTVE
jgi:hypothetical protein